ncbi:MAG: DEAD/DEAH box helicase family protein [Syntrophorhabdus sp.]|nr:DEAD/DEAH box helicase family protein [Syntrophorhabdus sp.]
MAKPKKAKPSDSQTIISLEQKLPEVPDRDPYSPPTMYLEKDGKGGYVIVPSRRPSKTLLVEEIRKEVDNWRESGYKKPAGISNTSLRLLEWWFDETHFFKEGEEFKYYFAQREAIETIIYLYEVKGFRDAADLIFKYMDPGAYTDDLFTTKKRIEETTRNKRVLVRVVPETGLLAQQELPQPDHYRYAIKMATGSGKTLVMAMAIVWSFFHKKFENASPLSKTFLIIAPNVIVFERLREDFEGGTIFKDWDLIPSEWIHDWQMTFIMRGESRKTVTEGTLYLTNIHQLYEDKNGDNKVDPVTRLLGPKPKDAKGSWEEDILERIKKHKDLLIINDEAHHVHDTDLEWYKVILNLHNNLKENYGSTLSLQLDFSATPKDQNGTFFPWIICDYPLAQAIEDRIVKAPLIVHKTDKADPEKYSRASVAYAEWINIAISRWKEHYEAYGKVGAKPVLFIMAENTKDADDIYEALKDKAEFSGKGQLLLIHTDKKGEISEKDLKAAREAARSIDLPSNRIRAIVSVLMLREGWDVRNVSVILGLRPFTAKANILPEQSVGRGLRLMKNIGPEYIQIVEIIGTQKFEEFVKGLEVEGVGVGVTRDTPDIGKYIYPVKIKAQYNIEIPILTPTHTREFKGIDESVLKELPANPQRLSPEPGATRKVTLVETVTQKTVGHKQVTIDTGIPEINDILSHLAIGIGKEARIDGQFALIFSVVKKYVQEIFFGQKVDIEDERIRRALSSPKNNEEIISILAKAIGDKSITRTISKLRAEPLSLIELDGFYWRRDWVELDKTVFNITPCFNDFEKHFAQFLDRASDITKLAKLAETYTKFSIEYLNHKGAISSYYPDFVTEQKHPDGKLTMWLIETKGWEQADVALKDARAEEWCRDATRLTGTEWKYVKVKHMDYMKMTNNLLSMPTNTFRDFLIKLKGKAEYTLL